MKMYFQMAAVLASVFILNTTAHAEARYEAVKKIYDQSSQRAEFSDFEAMQKNGFINCASFHASEPDEAGESVVVYLARKKNDGGPMFPPTIEKKVTALYKAGAPERLFNLINMSKNERELISYTAATNELDGTPSEVRFRKSGSYIAYKNTVTWGTKTYTFYGYCWK